MLLLSLVLIGSVQVSAAVYTTKPETKFYTEPNGERINIGAEMIETPPLERKDDWCFFKLRDGRGAAINPPPAPFLFDPYLKAVQTLFSQV